MLLEDRGRHIWRTVTEDMCHYTGPDYRPWSLAFLRRLVEIAYAYPGLIAVLVYRYGQWVEFRCRVPVVRQVCNAYYYYFYHWVRTRLQIEVPRTTCIDGGFRIDHYGSVVINSMVLAGRNLHVTHGVVIGASDHGVPTLGDDVVIGTGATVIGGIVVGDHAVIGARAVVTRDVPPYAVVAGVPARVLRYTNEPGREAESDEEDRVRDTAHQD